jgi:hypothetical protein
MQALDALGESGILSYTRVEIRRRPQHAGNFSVFPEPANYIELYQSAMHQPEL